MTIVNPTTGEVLRVQEADSPRSLRSKLEDLQSGQRAWARKSLSERTGIVVRFASLLEAQQQELALTLTSEMGKPIGQARNEIVGACGRIAWMTANAGKYLADEWMKDRKEMIAYEPLGVICNISAWNYPYLVGVNVFVAALLAGDAVMYKPSEWATLTGLEIGRLMQEAGVPRDVFHVAVGGKETGQHLVQLPFDGFFFTGSYRTGKAIYEQVALRMVPCQCELGGKDPLYVCDDVDDIGVVAAATADGAFYNNGQSCCAVERIYVHAAVYDKYLNEFVEVVRGWRIGNPVEDGIYFGPLARKEQLDVLEAQVRDALSKGARLLLGGKRIPGKGYYFEPTLLTNVSHSMAVMRDETFGPVIGIMKVEDDEDAVRHMADTEFGLTAAVYSSSRERAIGILEKLDAGTGYWNCCDRLSPALPWTGRKHSGIGVTLSHAGLRAFTKMKAYHFNG